MDVLVQKFRDVVKGILSGFDRIVFKGTLSSGGVWGRGHAFFQTAGYPQ
jgi:hypothetical protein